MVWPFPPPATRADKLAGWSMVLSLVLVIAALLLSVHDPTGEANALIGILSWQAVAAMVLGLGIVHHDEQVKRA